MYISPWLFGIAFIAGLFVWVQRRKSSTQTPDSIAGLESAVSITKAQIFSLEHFESPHFIDVRDAFEAMEVNYYRLKQRFSNDPAKGLELAKDWLSYTEALQNLKFAREMLDLAPDDHATDAAMENLKKSSIIKDEIEKKFKPILGDDWRAIPPDYFSRVEMIKNDKERSKVKFGGGWKDLYADSMNLYTVNQQRKERRSAASKRKSSTK